MKFTFSWLREYLETSASATEIADCLNAIGLEVEELTNPADALRPFQVAHIVEAKQHPNADRLRVCDVKTGAGQVQVVCGAPNARSGLTVIFAPPGTYIPGSDITIKTGEIRGVTSAGMLCSWRELGLPTDDDSGIAELPADAPVGDGFATWRGLDDPLFDIAITPNRGDAMSVRGIARDLAAAGLGTLKPLAAKPVAAGFASPISWRIDWLESCPWVLGRVVRNVKNGPSPAWLQDRLLSVGLRPINKLVDITNYFSIDLGRPLHVFDAGKVSGSALTIRRGAGESFQTLHGKELTVTKDDCVIADAEHVLSLAGVMGGESTGCSDQTTDVFIECALFDPVAIGYTGRRHGVHSDARARFERGVDQALLPAALDAATNMVLDLCGGEASDVASAGQEPSWQRDATLRFERMHSFAGLSIEPDEIENRLNALGFTTKHRSDSAITVAVPPWRNDVASRAGLALGPSISAAQGSALTEAARKIEPECDLIEEVLRLGGLDAVPSVSLPPLTALPGAALTRRQSRTVMGRRILASRGLLECVTFSFTDSKLAGLFAETPSSLQLTNPIAADLDQMRPSLVINLATAAVRNAARGHVATGLFEIGPVFGQKSDGETIQTLEATCLRADETPRHPLQASRKVDVFDAQADALALLSGLGVAPEGLMIDADGAPGYYHPGRSGVLRQGKLIVARFGELHPTVLAALDCASRLVACEVVLDAIPDPKQRRKAAPALSAFQPVHRDFAFIVDQNAPVASVVKAAKGAERNLIADVSLFDIFSGGSVPEGQKSVGIEVIFQPRDRSLTEAELEAASGKVVEAVAKATGGVLR